MLNDEFAGVAPEPETDDLVPGLRPVDGDEGGLARRRIRPRAPEGLHRRVPSAAPARKRRKLLLAERYVLEERISQGESSTIWRARDETLERRVAVKILNSQRSSDLELHRRLHNEATVAKLSHPNLVAVYDIEEAWILDGVLSPFIVMELLTGERLGTRLDHGPMPWPQIVDIGAQVAAAIAAAHFAGIVHQRLTTTRVLLTETGVKVLGLSGPWIPPEEPAEPGSNQEESARAMDVHALGTLLTQMMRSNETGSADHAPAGLTKLRAACLASDPAARPAAAQVAECLAELAETTTLTVPEPVPAADIIGAEQDPPSPGAFRPRQFWWGLAATVMATIVSVAFLLLLGSPTQHSSSPAIVATGGPPAPATTAPASPEPEATTAPRTTAPRTTRRQRPPVRSLAPPPSSPTEVPIVAGAIDALTRARQSVDEGVARRQIRPDVGVDLNNIINARLRNAGAQDLARTLNDLRRKVATRTREGGITPGRAAELDAILSQPI